MRKIYLIALSLVVFYACETEQKSTKITKPAELEERVAEDESLRAEIQGEYYAELPCSDCEKMQFKISIDNEIYMLKYAKEGGDQASHYEEGRYYIKDHILVLQSDKNEWQLKVGNDELHLLNFEGRKLKDNEVEKYLLKKY